MRPPRKTIDAITPEEAADADKTAGGAEIHEEMEDSLRDLSAKAASEGFPEQPRQEDIEAEKKALSERELAVQKREWDVQIKEINLTERERNAEKGFLKEQIAAADCLRKELEQLHKEIHEAEAELARKKREMLEELDQARHAAMLEQDRVFNQRFEELQNELEDRHDKLLRELDDLRDTKYKELSAEIEKRRRDLNDELQSRRNTLKEAERAVQAREVDLAVREKKQQEQEINFQAEKGALEAFKKEWKKQVEEKYRNCYEDDVRSSKEYAEQLRRSLQEQNEELAELRRRDGTCGGRSREQLQAEIDDLKKLLETEKRRPSRDLSEAETEYLAKGRLYDSLEEKNQKLHEEIKELRLRLHRQEMTRADVNMAQMRSERLEIERNAMEQELDRCKETIQRLRVDYLRPEEEAARIADITKGKALKPGNPDTVNLTERGWLERTRERCRESGFQVSSRLLYSFHTALKTAEWSPITVLAGVSGTGKSMLPKLYARFGGLYFLSLPVQPDWDSSQSLFGFFNAIDNKFNPTELLTAMVQMQSNDQPDISGKMLLVLLDEMNLAHVELYFSELLSKLEERRGETEDKVSINIDLGSGLPKYPVKLTKNVLWVGTMNEDETTKTLSDKVIDRSSILTFPRPTEFARREHPQLARESDMLLRTKWEEWLNAKCRFEDADIEEMKKATESINNALAFTGRALGHRVWQSIEQYMANHPCVIGAQDDKARRKYMQMAFEEALVQKVMPKLRGIELTDSVRRGCLDPIQSELKKSADGLLGDYQKAVSDDAGLFLWRSSQYLETDYD